MLYSPIGRISSRRFFAMVLARILLIIVATSGASTGNVVCGQQSALSDSPGPKSFEAASFKLVHGQPGPASFTPWGQHQFRVANVSLKVLISLAYGIDSRYINGIPKQLDEARYTVSATPPGDVGLTYEQIHAPLQRLLIERLHLTVHRETAEVSGYRLTTVSRGAKLVPAMHKSQQPAFLMENEIRANGVSLTSIAGLVSSVVDRPVEDGTGIAGDFDFDIHFSRTDQQDSDLPSVFTALEEQYGLKLVSTKINVPVLIVDHTDLEPAAD